jgi:hypothetical protein
MADGRSRADRRGFHPMTVGIFIVEITKDFTKSFPPGSVENYAGVPFCFVPYLGHSKNESFLAQFAHDDRILMERPASYH